MINLNARTNPAKIEHIHTRDREVAIRILSAICHPEHIYHDADLSKRAGYAVFSVRLDEYDPKQRWPSSPIWAHGTR